MPHTGSLFRKVHERRCDLFNIFYQQNKKQADMFVQKQPLADTDLSVSAYYYIIEAGTLT